MTKEVDIFVVYFIVSFNLKANVVNKCQAINIGKC